MGMENMAVTAFSSRKFYLAIVNSVLIVGCGALGGVWPGFVSSLSTVITGIVTVYAVYCGANVGTKFATVRTAKRKKVSDVATEPVSQGD